MPQHLRTIVTVMLFFPWNLWAQNARVPIQLVLFESVPTYTNAAFNWDQEAIKVGNQSQFGAFSEIRQFYGFANFPVSKNKELGMGISTYAMSEGQLINEYRAKAAIWKAVKLNSNLTLVGGAHAGLINTRLSATTSTAGGSSWVPDIDFGLSLNWGAGRMGISADQLTNSTGQPLSQRITFSRYWTFYFHQSWLTPSRNSWHLTGDFFANQTLPNLFRIKVNYDWQQKFHCGLGYGSLGPIFSMGVVVKNLLKNPIVAQIAYQATIKNNYSSTYQPLHIHFTIPIKN